MSKSGLGSRREARSWIAAGRLAVNGRTILDPDQWIDLERDRIEFDGAPLMPRERVHLVLHKPVGVLTTYRDPEKRPTVYNLLPDLEGFVFPVGRLDRDTSGLLLVTNDSLLAERVMNPVHAIGKTYRVRATRRLDEGELDRLRNGLELEDGPTLPARAERGEGTTFDLTIFEGRNRQVRRMVEALGAEVVELARIAIGSIALGDLPCGSVRKLTEEEIGSLLQDGGDA